MLNYNPQTTPCIFKVVVQELQSEARIIDFQQHTKCYLFTLAYLGVMNIFPYDCISNGLKPETLLKCFGECKNQFV